MLCASEATLQWLDTLREVAPRAGVGEAEAGAGVMVRSDRTLRECQVSPDFRPTVNAWAPLQAWALVRGRAAGLTL